MIDRRQEVHQDVVRTPYHTATATVEHTSTVVPTERERRMASLARTQRVIFFVASLLAIIILFRFVLLALGANPANGFANLIYGLSWPLVLPFQSLFGGPPQYGSSVFEFSSLIAIAVYYLIALGISKIITLATAPPDPTGEAYH